MSTIWQLIEQRAAQTPDAVIFVTEDDTRMTFGEFRDAAEV